MLLFVTRYAFVFWFMIGNKADVWHLNQMAKDDMDLYRTSACTAGCMQGKRNDYELFNNCYETCRNKFTHTDESQLQNLTRVHESLIVELVCRDDRSLTFRIDAAPMFIAEPHAEPTYHKQEMETETTTTITNKIAAVNDTTNQVHPLNINDMSNFRDALYIIKISVAMNVDELLVYVSDDKFFTIKSLKNNTDYKLTIVAVYVNKKYSVIAKEQKFKTLQRGFTPGMVKDVYVKELIQDRSNNMQLKAKIAWQPSADRTCDYNIVCFSETNDMDNINSWPFNIRDNPQQLYTYDVDNLNFSHKYRVGIRAKNPNITYRESELAWGAIDVPSCLEWYHYNYNVCAPIKPEDLEVEQKNLDGDKFSLNITWKEPKHYPDYYNLRIVDMQQNGSIFVRNLSKEVTSFYIPEITIVGPFFEGILTAYTPGGSSDSRSHNLTRRVSIVMQDNNYIAKLISGIFASIFCIAILSLTIFIICHRRAKSKRYQERCKYFEELEKKAPIDPKATFDFPTKRIPLLTSPEDLTQFQLDLEEKIFFNDTMEIERTDVELFEVLGEGAFGLVRRGIYKDDKLGPREVAVKMLKDHPSVDDMRAFRREIEVMKSVEKHPNIVGIIGHCTKRYNEMMLVTEYCSFGNLLDFLREEWNYLHELKQQKPSNNFSETLARQCCKEIKTSTSNCSQSGQKKHQKQRQQHLNHNTNSSSNSSNNNYNTSNTFNLDATIIEKLKFKYKTLNSILEQRSSKDDYRSKRGSNGYIEDITNEIGTSKTVKKASMATATTTTTTGTGAATTTKTRLTSATENKTYGYADICTSACKCQVDVIVKNVDDNEIHSNGRGQLERTRILQQQTKAAAQTIEAQQYNKQTAILPTSSSSTPISGPTAAAATAIQVRNCDCQQMLLLAKNKRNAVHVKFDSRSCGQNATNKAKFFSTTNTTMPLSVDNKTYFKYADEVQQQDPYNESYQLQQQQQQQQQQQPKKQNRKSHDHHHSRKEKKRSPVHNCKSNQHHLSSTIRREPLSAADLLDIAKQVAVGMEFLAKNKVVHRDLAARNVLVAPDRTIKIADFGLSRDIYQENIYKKTGNGKLPIKWLALESMTHQVYTTLSDVWSYGILLYEIATLGGTPYPSIPTNRLLHLLKTGYRMERPQNCGESFYKLMSSCWNVNPSERPNFTEIIKIIDDMLSDSPEQQISSILNMPNVTQAKRMTSTMRSMQMTKNTHSKHQQRKEQKEAASAAVAESAAAVGDAGETTETVTGATNSDDSYLKPL